MGSGWAARASQGRARTLPGTAQPRTRAGARPAPEPALRSVPRSRQSSARTSPASPSRGIRVI